MFFNFIWKALFVLKIFKFSSLQFRPWRKTANKEALVTGKQIIAVHISPNISRRKGNQTMKFGQLIKYNMRNIFLKKS